MRSRMAVESSSPGGIRRVGSSSNDERAALEGMLKGYPVEQLVEEVLVAWDELGTVSYTHLTLPTICSV